MEINCAKCEFFGKCDFFPVLSEWTGNCQRKIPCYWESKTVKAAAPVFKKPAELVFFREFKEKEPSPKTLSCSNVVCAKKSWCNDNIAQHCKLFQPKKIKNDNERKETCYDDPGNKVME
jgi:hypothetical protein